MQYRSTPAHPERLSVLGFGCMRFPRRLGGIDEEAAFALLQAALDAGVNYFDTAYIYPGSEEVLGKFLERSGCRDRVHVATKLPHYLLTAPGDLEKYFSEQLRRLRTDYIDYYLMHMLPDPDTWARLKGLGIEAWLAEKRSSGQIRQVGFSYHGSAGTFCRLVDAGGWDFCQIQYNYLDETSQAGRSGLEYAAARGLPVIIMEPLRGGRLAGGLPEGAKKLLERENISPAALSFRWLWDQPGVTVVLSGMNFLDAVAENAAAAEEAVPGCFTDRERSLLDAVRRELNAKVKVGCTGCGYCMPCPRGVDIPGAFRRWNEFAAGNRFKALKEHFMCTAMRPNSAMAVQCVQCGRCKARCPQSIDVPAELKRASAVLESPPVRALAWALKKSKRF